MQSVGAFLFVLHCPWKYWIRIGQGLVSLAQSYLESPFDSHCQGQEPIQEFYSDGQ